MHSALNPLGTHGGRDLLMEVGRKQQGDVGEHPILDGVGFMESGERTVGRCSVSVCIGMLGRLLLSPEQYMS